jgi:hypothetical protein
MFDKEGYIKGHSVSYQVFNAALAIDFLTLLKGFGDLDREISMFVKNIVNTTRTFAPFFMKENGQCFPVGDSFRDPIPQMEKVFALSDDADITSLLKCLTWWPATLDELLYANGNFFIYKHSSIEAGRLHLFFTCCWHSQNHKQNDELAFCLEVDGRAIVDEVGYTEFVPWEKALEHQREILQSNFSILGLAWSETKTYDGSSRILDCKNSSDELLIEAEHRRMPGFVATRTIRYAKKRRLLVCDRLRRIDAARWSGEIEHRFVLSPDAKCRIEGARADIFLDGTCFLTPDNMEI